MKRHVTARTRLLKFIDNHRFFFPRDIRRRIHGSPQPTDLLRVKALHHQCRGIFPNGFEENSRLLLAAELRGHR